MQALTELAAMGPQAEGRQGSPQHQTRGEARPRVCLRALEGAQACGRLISDFRPPDGESTRLCLC